LRTAYSGKFGTGKTPLEFGNQTGTELVARGFAGDEGDAKRAGFGTRLQGHGELREQQVVIGW
jgi:hypothetical protein